MLIIISIIVGYALGIAPFLYSEYKKKPKKVEQAVNNENNENMTEIINEWINGEPKEGKQNKQEEIQKIYEEFIGGK